MKRPRRAVRAAALTAALLLSFLALSRCGVPLFSPDAVLASHLIGELDYDGQAVVAIPENSNNFDPANLRFIPSRVRPIATYGPDGVLVGEDSYGVGILIVCPNPYDSNPATSGVRIMPNSSDGFGIADNDPLHLHWIIDTVTVSTGYDEYYTKVVFNYGQTSVDTWNVSYPTQSSSLQSFSTFQNSLDSIVQTPFPGSVVVGGSMGIDATSGQSNLYIMLRNSAGNYVPVLCTVASADGSVSTAGQIGGGEVPIPIASSPTNGAYFYDPASGQEYFSYESAGKIRTLSWVANIPGVSEIPVHDLPKAILPGGKLYVEKDGQASVYDAAGSLVGKVNTGGLRFVHMRWISPTEQKMVFTYSFAAPYDGQKGVYLRTYSTSVSHFLSLLD
ncbi:hypothetical protein [Salinispira pacifica]